MKKITKSKTKTGRKSYIQYSGFNLSQNKNFQQNTDRIELNNEYANQVKLYKTINIKPFEA